MALLHKRRQQEARTSDAPSLRSEPDDDSSHATAAVGRDNSQPTNMPLPTQTAETLPGARVSASDNHAAVPRPAAPSSNAVCAAA